MLLAPKWEVSENGDVFRIELVASEGALPCAAENGDDDDDYNDGDDDEINDDDIHAYQDATILANKRIELKHEVSIAQSGHDCHLLTVLHNQNATSAP